MYNGDDSSPLLISCMFVGNSATPSISRWVDHRGGAIANVYAGTPMLIQCTFARNSALIRHFRTPRDGVYDVATGGGIHNEGTRSIIVNCIFSGNRADSHGGGLFTQLSDPVLLVNCAFTGNEAGQQGGGLAGISGNTMVSNCLLWDNRDIDGVIGRYRLIVCAPAISDPRLADVAHREVGGNRWAMPGKSRTVQIRNER